MNWTSFLAEFLGIYLLIIATLWLTRRKPFEKGIRDVIASDGMFALSGAIHIILGLMIILLHPVWKANWEILITMIGVSSLVQGIIRLAFPERARRKLLYSIDHGYWIWITFAGLLGLFLTYKGFTTP